MEETKWGKRAVKKVLLSSKGCDKMVPEPVHSVLSPCVGSHVSIRQAMCMEWDKSHMVYVCLSARFGRPIMCSFRVLSDSAKINKKCSFHATQPFNESQLLLVMSFEETIICSNSGNMNQYVLSFLLPRFEYKNNLATDHKSPSGSGLGNQTIILI